MFEFSERFTDCNALGFLEKWNNFAHGLNTILNSQYDSSMFFTNWPQDIENVLIPLKLFPASKTGKNGLARRDTFYKASEKLIVFFEVIIVSEFVPKFFNLIYDMIYAQTGTPPSEMIRNANKFPYMVAYGAEKKTSNNFILFSRSI